MRIFASLVALLRNLDRKKHVERELAEEVNSYLELSANAKVRKAAARRAATLDLGGVEQVKEEVRQIRLGHRQWLGQFLRDRGPAGAARG